MKTHRYISIFLIFVYQHFYAQNIQAQNITHYNFWSRVSVLHHASETWKSEIEFQHRRQNDVSEQEHNIFHENLLSSIRAWFYYQYKNSINISLSPLGYYWHNSVITKEEDKVKPQIKEIRFSIAVDGKHEVVDRLLFISRICLELRDFQYTSSDLIRVRNRFGIRYEFSDNWNVSVFDEIFVNVQGVEPQNFFDHNRVALLVNYKPIKHIRIEAGYMSISRLPRNTAQLLREHNILLNVSYEIPR